MSETATIHSTVDLALELEELLLSVGHAGYDRDPQIILNTAEAIAGGFIRTICVDLPEKFSSRAEQLGRQIRSNSYDSARAIEWAFCQGWHDVKPEWPLPPYGKPDAFIESQRLIIEVGDCRVDKPLQAIRLGYTLLVVPEWPCSLGQANYADATLFFPGHHSPETIDAFLGKA